MHRSVSQLTSKDRCGWSVKLKEEGHKPTKAAWTMQGNAFHTAAEAWERSGRMLTIREVQDVFADDYDRRIVEATELIPDHSKWLRGGNISTAKDIEKRRKLGLEQVEEYIYYAARSGLTPVIINGQPAVELEVRIDAGDFDILGYIDLVLQDSTGTLLIRDLKTGNKPAWPIQLVTYGYAFEETTGRKVWWGDYYLAKQGVVTSPVDLTCISKVQLVRWFQDLDAEKRAGYFRPNPGDACFACDQKLNCEFAA